MAKISTYQIVQPEIDDIVIGSEISDSNATKNFRLGDIAMLLRRRGFFYHNSSQTAAVRDTGYPMRFGFTDPSITSGFSIVNDGNGHPTEITPTIGGRFNLSFSAQVLKPSGSEHIIDTWLRVDGVDIPSSNASVTLKANSNNVLVSRSFFVNLDNGSSLQIMWAVDDVSILLQYSGANGVHPATPSSVAMLNQI